MAAPKRKSSHRVRSLTGWKTRKRIFTCWFTLQDSDAALKFEAIITPQIADTTHGRDALALLDSGLAIGLSPGFMIPPKRAVANAEKVTDERMDPSGQNLTLGVRRGQSRNDAELWETEWPLSGERLA